MSWKCPICQRPVTVDYIEAAKKKYHQPCFKCERCDDYLAGKQYAILEGGHPFCANCARAESPHGSIMIAGGFGEVNLNFEGKDKYTEMTVSNMVCGYCGDKLNNKLLVKGKTPNTPGKKQKLFCSEACKSNLEEQRRTRAANHPTRDAFQKPAPVQTYNPPVQSYNPPPKPTSVQNYTPSAPAYSHSYNNPPPKPAPVQNYTPPPVKQASVGPRIELNHISHQNSFTPVSSSGPGQSGLTKKPNARPMTMATESRG
eukprot:TRINITY_DN11936_c0_g1_i1.p1 TRINITY_DN11936_c0_g1~~TRINITY_DN11936_c0_g1_i1.p1  ORF type:complete len:271 (-),score=70.20 TRINITY_DN11936_c0_g1_i1:65-835(-)